MHYKSLCLGLVCLTQETECCIRCPHSSTGWKLSSVSVCVWEVHTSTLVCMCVLIVVDPISSCATCCSHSPDARILDSFFYWILFLIWPYRIASFSAFESSTFIGHWWHSSLDWTANQMLLMYSLRFMRLDPRFMKSLPFASMKRKGLGISGAFICAHIFFHFSRGFYLGFKMWIISIPP